MAAQGYRRVWTSPECTAIHRGWGHLDTAGVLDRPEHVMPLTTSAYFMHFHLMASTMDRQVEQLARRQHGAFSRAQAIRCGATARMIGRRLESGAWLLLDAAVYALPGNPPTWLRQIKAAELGNPYAAVSHRAAAALHELTGFRQGRPEITVPPGAHARSKIARVHRGVDFRCTEVQRITVVTKAQAIVDISQVCTQLRVSRAVEDLAAREGALLDALRDRYVALAPRGGRDLRPLRAILERYGTGFVPLESELERVMRDLFDQPDLPPISWQHPFPWWPDGPSRVDGLMPDWNLILEGDGRAWHTRVSDFERDHRRDAEALANGYLPLRFTWHQLIAEPTWCLSMLRRIGTGRLVAA
jgi:hypothetical protein